VLERDVLGGAVARDDDLDLLEVEAEPAPDRSAATSSVVR
jgi:hypothetical protein